ALQQVENEYYVLLNSDIEVGEHWLEPLLELMDSDKNIAACQPKMLSFADKAYFEYAGAGGGFIDKFGYPFCRGRLFQHVEKDEGQYNDVREVFWASGACMFVRAELYHQMGGLDDDFFAHMEEIDFCWRLKNAGYKIMYCPHSSVYHIGGGTLPKNSPRKTYLNFRNNLSMLYKNLPSSFFTYVMVSRLFLDGVASMKFLVDGGWGDFFAVLRAHAHFYRKLPALQAKRKKNNPQAVRNVYRKNIVIEYFLKRKTTYDTFDEKYFS
ncbi:MAG: glycosyltransferase family 2 protein, partial [Bacteroidales bacterium]|nr:glycosyltransferase family 2 protein [Bacteroidales bacterium]